MLEMSRWIIDIRLSTLQPLSHETSRISVLSILIGSAMSKNEDVSPTKSPTLTASPIVENQVNWYYATLFIICAFLIYLLASQLFYVSLGLTIGFLIFIWTSSRRLTQRTKQDTYKSQFPRFAFTRTIEWEIEENILLKNSDTGKSGPIFPEDFLISDTLDNLINLIIRDFVLSWHQKITPNPTFPIELKSQIFEVIKMLKDRLSSAELSELLVYKLIPLINDHFDNFVVAHDIVTNKNSSLNRNLTSTWDLDNVICANYNKGKLHPAIHLKGSNSEENTKKWLSSFLGRYLPYMVSRNELNSPPVFILLREIVSTFVLFPVIKMFADPDFWNQMIVNKLGDIMKDRAHVKKFRNVLSKHTLKGKSNSLESTKPKSNSDNPLMKYRLTPTTDDVKYQKILKQISSATSSSDLRQYKYFLTLQINKSIRELAEVDSSPYSTPKSIEVLKIYSKRLQTLKALTESTLLTLMSEENARPAEYKFDPQTIPPNITLDIPLMQVLSQPSYLSYFMEFMDLRNRSLLLQFWLTVNGIRNPLEDLFDTSEADEIESLGIDDDDEDIAKLEVIGKDMNQADDIKQIFEQFFGQRLLKIDTLCYTNVAKFVETDPPNPLLYIKARKSILSLQKQVFDRMYKTDFVAFKQSDLFLRLLASDTEQSRMGVRMNTVDNNLKEDDESNGDPLASFEEGTGTDDRKKISDAVLKAVEDALNEIMHDDVSGGHPISAGDSSISGNKGISKTNSSSDVWDVNTSPLRNSRLVNKDIQKDLFGLGKDTEESEITLFDSDAESDKSSGKLFHDESDYEEDDYNNFGLGGGSESLTSSLQNLSGSQELKVAQPGDLNLNDEIDKLSKDIERLETQILILDPLQRKAELTNNVAELKILEKSKASLEREINLKELQKQQFIVQENDNSLYGKTKVRIQSYVTGNEDGKDFILYIIDILKVSTEAPEMISAGWLVARRFSQFYKLHNYLRQKYPLVNNIPFPKRKVVLKFQQTALIDKRQKELETYLVSLLEMQDVCSDRLFRHFLSSNTFNIEDKNEFAQSKNEGGKGRNAVNMATRLYNGLSSQLSNVKYSKSGDIRKQTTASSFDDTSKEMQQELTSFDAEGGTDIGKEPFVKPICDLLVSLFTLQKSNVWIRGRAVLLLLQQLLGSTIEKITRQYVDSLKSPTLILNILLALQNSLWPDGQWKKSGEPRSQLEKSQTRIEAQKILELFIVDSFSAVFGNTNSKYAANALFSMLQNEVLNTHLFLNVLQELFTELYPEQDSK